MVGCVCVQFRHKAPIAFLAMGAADRSQMKESCTWNLLLGAMNSTRVRRETSEKVSNFSVFIFGYRLPLESHSMREEMCYRMSSSTLGMRKITATFKFGFFSSIYFWQKGFGRVANSTTTFPGFSSQPPGTIGPAAAAALCTHTTRAHLKRPAIDADIALERGELK